MKNLKDIITERLNSIDTVIFEKLQISRNKPRYTITWEDFCDALVNYLPRKNAKKTTIFVKNLGITEDIYANSDFHNNKNGEAKDKLICITGVKNRVSGDIHLSVGTITDRHDKYGDNANCYTFVNTFDEFKAMFKENYAEVMNIFYHFAMKKQRQL